VIALETFVAAARTSPLAPWLGLAPWALTARAAEIVESLRAALGEGFHHAAGVAVHTTATIEPGAMIKPPAIVGPACRVAAGAYLRGGVWLARACTVGPGAEVKSSFLFDGSALAHFNFVGDAILGAGVNLEAGAIVANHRNERADKLIRVRVGGTLHATGIEKFGALIGDGARIGANAVIAPGTLLAPGTVVARLALVDQDAPS
jgi:NDP-sugar pyrophosphorylase family protein